MNKILVIFIFALSTVSVLLFSHKVFADFSPSIGVFPEKFELSLSRGDVSAQQLRVINKSDLPLPIHLALARWDAKDEVGGINFESGVEDKTFDITRWIKLSKNDFILNSGETERVGVTISVPKNAEPGGKYGAVMVEPAFPSTYFNEGSARVLPQIGVLFLVDIPSVALEGGRPSVLAGIEQFGVDGRSPVISSAVSRLASLFKAPLSAFAAEPKVNLDILSRAADSFVLRVKNNDISHIKVGGSVSVINAIGEEAAKADLPSTTILPGKLRLIPIKFTSESSAFLPQIIKQQLALGRYTATVVLTGVGAEPLVKTIHYWVFPWQGLFVLFVVFAAFGFGFYRGRGRFRAALAAFLRYGRQRSRRVGRVS